MASPHQQGHSRTRTCKAGSNLEDIAGMKLLGSGVCSRSSLSRRSEGSNRDGLGARQVLPGRQRAGETGPKWETELCAKDRLQ